MDHADPNQWNGYGYASNNPVTASDPDGRMACMRIDDRNGPCASNTKAVADYTGYTGPVNSGSAPPPGCNNKHGPKCMLTEAEADAKRKVEKMVRHVRDSCANGGRDPRCIVVNYAIKQGASEEEAAWCFFNIDICKTAWDAKQLAQDLANKAGDEEDWTKNDKGQHRSREWNAYHHAMWFAIMAQSGISAEDAMLLGAAHEIGAFKARIAQGNLVHNWTDYGEVDSRTDMHNNMVGYKIGRSVPINKRHVGSAKGGATRRTVNVQGLDRVIRAAVNANCGGEGCLSMVGT
jgi:hypothetical protein